MIGWLFGLPSWVAWLPLPLLALRWPQGVPMQDSVPWATTPGVATTGEA